jgi:RND superfamily putative drug exporter
MIFTYLGYLVRKGGILFLLGWGLLLACAWRAAPPWDEVALDKEFAFLPEKAPSRQAEKVFAEAFPDERLNSNIVLILHRAETGRLEEDRTFIENSIYPGLRRIAEEDGGLASEQLPSEGPLFGGEDLPPKKNSQRSIISRILTPRGLEGPLLVRSEGRALLVVMELTTEYLAKDNWSTLEKVERLVADLRQQGKVPRGLDIAITGSAAIGRDHSLAALESAHTTTLLTVILVVALLLLIYRAPLLALIPLVTVFVAVQLSLYVLALLAGASQITLFQGIEVYITILSYGAGVDYCLFLTARYKEELDHGLEPGAAIEVAIGSVGAALTASAGTVVCGIGMLLFAQFGKLREAGFAIPLSLALVLAATLTLSPALLSLAGHWAFWPKKVMPTVSPCESSSRYRGWGGWWFVESGALERFWKTVGAILVRRPATIWLVTVAIMAPFAILAGALHNRLSYDLIGDLPADAPSVVGTKVLQSHFPAGLMGPVTVIAVHPRANFAADEGRDLMQQVTQRLKERKEELGLADIRTLTSPLGIAKSADPAPAAGPKVPEETAQEMARQYYATSLGGRAYIGTRMDLVLSNSPFSQGSVKELDPLEGAVRAAFPPSFQNDLRLYVLGTTASVRDLTDVMEQDRWRLAFLVPGSVLIILVLLLRRLLISIYLLLSVLFSYYVTLGASFVVFWMLDPQGFSGINWNVAVLLFTILIAVGEDYNIFLLSRIDEEEKRRGPVRGITSALCQTGPIISTCGLIMAGTFCSLIAGSLTELRQLGFALAFGVLLETFLIRPILVPTFLILLIKGRIPFLGASKVIRSEQTDSK